VAWGIGLVSSLANIRLNLTAASYVFVFEPAWNPAIEQQAVDRVHRLGQTSDVNVIRYIAKGTQLYKPRANNRLNRRKHGPTPAKEERTRRLGQPKTNKGGTIIRPSQRPENAFRLIHWYS
jgi:hypothetical protein